MKESSNISTLFIDEVPFFVAHMIMEKLEKRETGKIIVVNHSNQAVAQITFNPSQNI